MARSLHSRTSPAKGCLFNPLGVLDALGVGLAVPLVHGLKCPAGLPQRSRDNSGTQPTVQEETEPRRCRLSGHSLGRHADRFDLPQCQVIVISHICCKLACLEPVDNVSDTNTASSHGRLAPVEPWVEDRKSV